MNKNQQKFVSLLNQRVPFENEHLFPVLQLENNQRKIRQREGIKLAQMKNIYTGRKIGAKTSPSRLILKYKNVADLLDKSELSVRRIAGITGHSINTVRKIKQLKAI